MISSEGRLSGESQKKVVEVVGDEQMMRLPSTRLLRCHSLVSVGKRVDGNPLISLPGSLGDLPPRSG